MEFLYPEVFIILLLDVGRIGCNVSKTIEKQRTNIAKKILFITFFTVYFYNILILVPYLLKIIM